MLVEMENFAGRGSQICNFETIRNNWNYLKKKISQKIDLKQRE